MDNFSLQLLIPIGAAITTLGGAYITIRKISKDIKKERKEQAAEILQEAKEQDAVIRTKLEARIESIRAELKNLEFNINKDLSYVKETQRNEIKVLGEKIDEIRRELREQYDRLVTILTEIVKKD